MSTTVTCENCHKQGEIHWRKNCPTGWFYFDVVELDLETHKPIEPVDMHTIVVFVCSEECSKNIWKKE
jgi:hypothetical protein